MKKSVLTLLAMILLMDCSFAGLSNFINLTKQGLNFTAAHAVLDSRESTSCPQGLPQPTTYAISGIPAGVVIEKAYFYWVVEGAGAINQVTIASPSGTTSTTAGVSIGQNNVGKCWGRTPTINFRADVTSIINAASPNGNYIISGLPTGAGSDTDGGTLIIIYSDCTVFWSGTLIINDGIDVYNASSASFNATQTAAITPPQPSIRNSRTFCLLSDYQNIGAVTLNINAGGAVPFAQTFWNWEEGSKALAAGQSSVSYVTKNLNPAIADCYDWVLVGAYWQDCSPPSMSSAASTACLGASTNFTITTPCLLKGVTYTWAGSGGFSSTTSSPSTNFTYGASGSYTFTVTIADATGCSITLSAVTVTVTAPCPLPINLLFFNVVNQEKSNLLSWTTAQESNNQYFQVQRSYDGQTFANIGNEIKGAGSSLVSRKYVFTDQTPFTGLNYYRIKQTDFDGKSTYSYTTSVFFSEFKQAMLLSNLSPVPVKNELDYVLQTVNEQEIEIQIIDISGKILKSDNLKTLAGINNLSVNVSNLTAGIYFLKINGNNIGSTMKRFIK